MSTVRSQNSGTEPRLWVETSITRPSSRRAFQQGDDGVLGLHVHAEGLVEQDHAGVLRQRAGEEHALPLPAGEFADLALPELQHVDAESVPSPPHGRRGGACAGNSWAVAAHHHHVFHQHGEASSPPPRPGAHRPPRCASRPRARSCRGWSRTPSCRREEAHDGLEQSGLARAVHPHQGGDGSVISKLASRRAVWPLR